MTNPDISMRTATIARSAFDGDTDSLLDCIAWATRTLPAPAAKRLASTFRDASVADAIAAARVLRQARDAADLCDDLDRSRELGGFLSKEELDVALRAQRERDRTGEVDGQREAIFREQLHATAPSVRDGRACEGMPTPLEILQNDPATAGWLDGDAVETQPSRED